MAWYAYCIVEQQAVQNGIRARRPVPVENLKGIADAQTFAYPSGDFSVIVSEYIPTGDLGQKALLQHAHVVSECFKRTTVLPFRFGTVFDTDESLRRAVRLNRKAFTESVVKLKGKAEMHLKLLIKDGSIREALKEIELPATVGSEYLHQAPRKKPPGSANVKPKHAPYPFRFTKFSIRWIRMSAAARLIRAACSSTSPTLSTIKRCRNTRIATRWRRGICPALKS